MFIDMYDELPEDVHINIIYDDKISSSNTTEKEWKIPVINSLDDVYKIGTICKLTL